MENLDLYNKLREVPSIAKKPIAAGRLKGMTDINPMWRIKALTETFGPCGIGWWYTIDKQWIEPRDGGEAAAFTNISLYISVDGKKSRAIPGTGGSMFVSNEKTGLHMSDEAFKMSLTDAISVAAKALGVGADVYWATDAASTKYSDDPKPAPGMKGPMICTDCGKLIEDVSINDKDYTAMQVVSITSQKYGKPLCFECARKRRDHEN